MGKKRPAATPVFGKPLVGEDWKVWGEVWDDDEWEQWRRQWELFFDGMPLLMKELKKKKKKISLEEGMKAIDDFRGANLARLAPGNARLGIACLDVAGDLQEFFGLEDRAVEVALPSLLLILRGRVGVLNMIADMLDPDKPGRWKLELRRRVRGVPSERRGSYYRWIALEYFELFEELKAQGVRSPAKETMRRLIKQSKWSENDIRAAVQWWRRRDLKLVR